MGKTEVKLLNGEILKVKRVSPFSLAEGLREKLRFLEDQTKGTSLMRFHRKLEREENRVTRLNRMVERCEAFVNHAETPYAKREEYLIKIETYEKEIEKSQENVDNLSDELIDLDGKIKKYARDIAIWYLHKELDKSDDVIDEITNDDVNINLVRAMLGLVPMEEDDEESPLESTVTSTHGVGG